MEDSGFDKIEFDKAGIKISLEFPRQPDQKERMERQVREILYSELKEKMQCL